MERFDDLVVGAGPAGSAAAMHLTRGGARVLLADKARFPRDKPWGAASPAALSGMRRATSSRSSSTSSIASYFAPVTAGASRA